VFELEDEGEDKEDAEETDMKARPKLMLGLLNEDTVNHLCLISHHLARQKRMGGNGRGSSERSHLFSIHPFLGPPFFC